MVQGEGQQHELAAQRQAHLARAKREKALAPDLAKTLKAVKLQRVSDAAQTEQGRPLDVSARYKALEQKLVDAIPDAEDGASVYDNAKAAILEGLRDCPEDFSIDDFDAIQLGVFKHLQEDGHRDLILKLRVDPDIRKVVKAKLAVVEDRKTERLWHIVDMVMELGESDASMLEKRVREMARSEHISSDKTAKFLSELRTSPEFLRYPCRIAAEEISNQQLREWFLKTIESDDVAEVIANLSEHNDILAEQIPSNARKAALALINESLNGARGIERLKNPDDALNFDTEKKLIDELIDLDFGDLKFEHLDACIRYLNRLRSDYRGPGLREVDAYALERIDEVRDQWLDAQAEKTADTFSDKEKQLLEYLVTGKKSAQGILKAFLKFAHLFTPAGAFGYKPESGKMQDDERLAALEHIAIKRLAEQGADEDVWDAFQTRLDDMRGWDTSSVEHARRVIELKRKGIGRDRFPEQSDHGFGNSS